MLKYLTLIYFVLANTMFVKGQGEEINQEQTGIDREGLISFSKVEYDFGNIEEHTGEVNVDFEFTNEGDGPLVISDVEASCGCTVPTWTADTVLPEKSGVIKVAYDPTNRPGGFNKTVTVTSNGKQAVTVLSIQGMVLPRPGDLASQYPLKIGGLNFRKNSLQFGNITTEKPVTKSIEAYNSTDRIIAFTGNSVGPKHINISFEPQAINPGQVGFVNVTYDGSSSRIGYNSDNIVVYTYELLDSVKQFDVYATVLAHFPSISKSELSSLPKLDVDKTIEDFGNVTTNDILKTEFTVYNNGKEPLKLEDVRSNCDCVSISRDKSTIQPGDSAKLFVKFEITPTTGTQQKLISVFSNDPTAHVKVLTVKAYVRD